MTKFLQGLLAEWQRLELPLRDAEVTVAVSGGADSTALLLALAELIQTKKLSVNLMVAHLDHGLRGKRSKEDARWVAKLAEKLGFRSVVGRVDVKKHADKTADNLEQAARRARYDFLQRIAVKHGAQVVLTAHTMDDQAETVLMNLLRGSGIDGLGGMEPVRRLNHKDKTILARPLLRWARRADTEAYCRESGSQFKTDEMNFDEKYLRVRVRRQLLPLMETYNSRVVEALSRTALLLREEGTALSLAADEVLQCATDKTAAGSRSARDVKNKLPSLRVDVLANAQPALRLRVLRQWLAAGRGDLRRLELVHVLAIEKLLQGSRGGRVVELPGGARVSRERGLLQFHPKSP